VPRRVNQIANRLLLLGAVDQRAQIDAAMLAAVLDEMAGERAVPEAAAKPAPAAPPAPPRPAAGIDHETFDTLLAERDVQIAELQQAIVELAGQQDSAGAQRELAALATHVARLEAQMAEQERTIHQTLNMLIDWVEGEMQQTRAA
jgi:hypothetical protein